MIEIKLNDQAYNLPENWKEVDPEVLPELLRELYVMPESGETYHNIIRILLGYKPSPWKKLMKQFFGAGLTEDKKEASATALAELLRLQSWMWSDELTAAPLKGLEVGGAAGGPVTWCVFEEGFTSMTFGELSDAYIHAQAFIKQIVEGEDRLDLLVATLCRPERSGDYENDPAWNGDKREPYNEHIARKRAELLKGDHADEKILVLMYFLGTVKNFFSYFDLFDTDGSKPPVPEDFPGQSMLKNQHLLSEKHIFGGMQATKTANVHEVFTFLEEHNKDIKEENKRTEARNKQ